MLPGSVCWIELGAAEQRGAKRFYGSLFGWTATDIPMGPDEVYTLFGLDGRNAAGCFALKPQDRAKGIAPHWMPYVSVENADRTSAAVAPAGGRVIERPFDVRDLGRMAVLQDPAGAVICAWQPGRHHGFGIENAPGAYCWIDLTTPDPSAAADFYAAVFGWLAGANPRAPGFLRVKAGDRYIAGVSPARRDKPPRWVVYFLVKDCRDATAQAAQAGGTVHENCAFIEGAGCWSVIADPQGALFGLFEPPEH